MYTISEVSKILEITTYTLRYYEKEGIVAPVRNANGERIYEESHLAWLRFVLRLKQTQMPIAQIRQYAQLYLEGEHTSQARLNLLEDHRSSVQEQIRHLTETEKMLNDKISNYKVFISKGNTLDLSMND